MNPLLESALILFALAAAAAFILFRTLRTFRRRPAACPDTEGSGKRALPDCSACSGKCPGCG